MSDPYANVMKGKLKLKGAALPTLGPQKKIKKKRKPVVKAPQLDTEDDSQGTTLPLEEEDIDTRTPAEKRYDDYLAKREQDKIQKMAAKSHRERIEEFNQRLANMSEHYDIPKGEYDQRLCQTLELDRLSNSRYSVHAGCWGSAVPTCSALELDRLPNLRRLVCWRVSIASFRYLQDWCRARYAHVSPCYDQMVGPG